MILDIDEISHVYHKTNYDLSVFENSRWSLLHFLLPFLVLSPFFIGFPRHENLHTVQYICHNFYCYEFIHRCDSSEVMKLRKKFVALQGCDVCNKYSEISPVLSPFFGS